MIDFHCHLDLYPQPTRIVERCRDERLYVLSVTTTPSAWSGTTSLSTGCERIRTALGIHPEIAHERIGELPLFEALLPKAKYVGEIGLDGSPSHRPHRTVQCTVLETVLEAVSRQGGRVMSIHSRKAADEVLDLLKKYPNSGIPVLHWFTGTRVQLKRALSQGCWFSVGPSTIRSKQGSAMLQEIPPDRIVTETDGPFCKVNGRPAVPWDSWSLVERIAEVWRIPSNEAREILLASFRKLVSFG